MEREYKVVMRGSVPTDLSEKVSRLHVEAIRHKKTEATAARAAAGAGSPAAPNNDTRARSSVLRGGAESRASPEGTAAEGGCS